MEKRKVGLVEGLKTIYDEADSQGAFDPIKEKLFKKAGDKKQNNNNDTESSANVSSETNTDKKNIDFSAGGFKPNLTDVANYNPNVNLAANFGGDKGFYADAGADASLQGGVNYNAEAGYKGKNVDAKVDTRGLQIGTGFGDDDANVNVNLAQGFDGDTNVNVEGKKQLNKYLDLKGFADTKGDYGASVGFDFKF
tara:strand:- start:49 stop:633 length:585 start_codon:yes stop_codon:yes gene_type:complete